MLLLNVIQKNFKDGTIGDTKNRETQMPQRRNWKSYTRNGKHSILNPKMNLKKRKAQILFLARFLDHCRREKRLHINSDSFKHSNNDVMTFYLNNKAFVESGGDAIYSELLSIVVPISGIVKDQLITVFNVTEDARVRDKIALIFADMCDKDLVPVLINKINEIRYSRHITTLIYACSEYDCAAWIEFFVNLAIEFDDSAYLEALSVIDAVSSPIKLNDQIICVKRVMDYLSSTDKGAEKYKDIEELLELIEDMATI